MEAGRPDSITKEKLLALKKNGISRISVNPQTMKQQTLDIIGRHHTVDDTIQSFKLARELGFDNINMDLIMGLPEESLDDVRHTMELVKELAPDNVTIHSLAVKRAARLTIFKDRYSDMQMVNTQEHMDLCAAYCKQMGLEPYYLYRQKGMAGNMENVGYAAKGQGRRIQHTDNGGKADYCSLRSRSKHQARLAYTKSRWHPPHRQMRECQGCRAVYRKD